MKNNLNYKIYIYNVDFVNDIDIGFVFMIVTSASYYGPVVIYRYWCKKFSFECFLISRP